jgi:hypothetical protein
MSPAPTRKRSPSHEAQPARWRALRTAGAALPRAPREQGGGPRSRAPTRPPRANLPPRGPQPDKAARWMAATAPALQWRAPYVACLARQHQGHRPRQSQGHPRAAAVLAFASDVGQRLVCRLLLPLSGIATVLGRLGTGRGARDRSLVAHRPPLAAAVRPGYGRAPGGVLVAGQKVPAQGGHLHRPPTGFFVPGAFT